MEENEIHKFVFCLFNNERGYGHSGSKETRNVKLIRLQIISNLTTDCDFSVVFDMLLTSYYSCLDRLLQFS